LLPDRQERADIGIVVTGAVMPRMDGAGPPGQGDEHSRLSDDGRCGMSAEGCGQSVLIVDDADEIRRALTRILSAYRPVSAGSAADALTILKAGPAPDLILLDMVMPHIDGFEFYRRLKANEDWRDIPVVFITGLSDEEHETRALALGAVDFIAKPFSPAVVRARVKAHLAQCADRETVVREKLALEDQVALRTRQIEAALEQIRNASIETIIRLSWAAEYKDEDTGEHALRMSYYSAAIARQLGFSEPEVAALLRAAPMHDIGKIGVPDHVLLKPGPLDPDEWEIMKQHTTIGARILAGSVSDTIKLASVVALSHHENWDGTGYPQGLRREEIPLVARIVAVADTFDAVVSKRPYKQACSFDTALAVLRDRRGTRLDPQVVDAFMAVKDEIVEIGATYQDRQASPLSQLLGAPWLYDAKLDAVCQPFAAA
jgi:putative two-component system response regulator